ncbi:DinB family protein [Rhodopirellula halodulae]|uniref:DinB family protein n=1 Tax=Rhodopirellula halodulae TaxID=2894198 RepID=UPI001E568FE9|nr:DinB family protein [Rhodopirellula sp. JC737]MCC9658493.1 DinB family protein [Rhodopirellula sp. JC737]
MLPAAPLSRTPLFRESSGFAIRLLASLGLLLGTVIAGPLNRADASPGDPALVQIWPNKVVSIETHWGFRVAITHGTKPTENLGNCDLTVDLGRAEQVWLQRLPNEDAVRAIRQPSDLALSKSDPNLVEVTVESNRMAVIQVDGMRIVVAADELNASELEQFGQIDLLVGDPSGIAGVSDPSSDSFVIRNWIPLDQTKADDIGTDAANQWETRTRSHNAVAVSAKTPKLEKQPPVRWLMATEVWTMPDEMDELFVAMERSCRESQTIFADLSVAQMNFRPANGTHTPRWNVEHMMGRQLLFFSQIYNAIDPSIPVMDLNPAQMPPDYEFAHADWTGAEEARQMQRVSKFTRRFAYLLDGYAVDEKAPASRWPTLAALLKQMERHYGEHTANTQKKFELPGWPSE